MSSDDVTFVYKVGGNPVTKLLKGSEKLTSREAIGLWRVGAKGWKVYGTTKELVKLTADYLRAAVDVDLPMGLPAPVFIQGTVKRANKPDSTGFVLEAEWMEGTRFQKNKASFVAALTRENIPKNKTDQTYLRVKRGCEGAKTVGLNDCQGFVSSKSGISQPLRFIDIHTSWNPKTGKYGTSGQADDLVTEINAWAGQ